MLTAVQARKAVLKAPAANGLTGAIVTIQGVDGVTVNAFAIRTLRFPSCDALDGIRASNAQDLAITGNDLRSVNPDTSRSCLFSGILALAGTTGTISGNTVKDFLEDGVHLAGAGTNVLVKDNTIRFVHVPFNAAGDTSIEVVGGAVGRVRENLIESPATPENPVGVRIDEAAAGTVVRGNTITGPASGVQADEVTGLLVKGNTVSEGQIGISLLQATDLDIHDNASSDNSQYGIFASFSAAGNDIQRNVAHGNGIQDCRDETPPPIDNTWVDNEGDESFPAGICEEFPA
jgi:parallel beta-helix repeat protein